MTIRGYWVLDGKEQRPAESVEEWALHGTKLVQRTEFTEQELHISTAFVGIDYNLTGEGPPLIFETEVRLHNELVDLARWSSYDDAEEGHQTMVQQWMERMKNPQGGQKGDGDQGEGEGRGAGRPDGEQGTGMPAAGGPSFLFTDDPRAADPEWRRKFE